LLLPRAGFFGADAFLGAASGKLAERGFAKERQAEAEKMRGEYLRLLSERGGERGQARTARVARDSLFEKLRWQTSYVRRVGRAALRHSGSQSAQGDHGAPTQIR